MEVDDAGEGSRYKSHRPRRSRRSSRKSTQKRRSPSTSSDEWKVDQATGSEQGSRVRKHSRPTCWDVKPLIPIPPIQPRRDVMKELKKGGWVTGLTSHRPHTDEAQERQQRDDRDCRTEGERSRQIPVGMAEQPIFLPHLQEPTLMAQLQPPCIVDQVRMQSMGMIIQKTA